MSECKWCCAPGDTTELQEIEDTWGMQCVDAVSCAQIAKGLGRERPFLMRGWGCTFRPDGSFYAHRIRTAKFIIEFPMPFWVEKGKTYTVLRSDDGRVMVQEGARMPPGFVKLKRYVAGQHTTRPVQTLTTGTLTPPPQ